MLGVPIKSICELMGHHSVTMTERYSHLSPATTRAAVQLLDRSGNGVATAGVLAEGLSGSSS
jgi:hypothetical protein